MFYRACFACDDDDELQQTLNNLYGYSDDIETKILHRKRMNLFFRLMWNLLRNGQPCNHETALDIGCNAGAYSRIISDFGFSHVYGIDVVPDYVDKARRAFAVEDSSRSIEFYVEDAERLSPSRKYDLILCTEVIEHVENPLTLVRRMREGLAPGGIAIISFPNSISLPYVLAVFIRKCRGVNIDEDLRRHTSFPFIRAIALLQGAGFRIIRTAGTNLFINGPLLRSLHRSRLLSQVSRIDSRLSSIWPLKFFSQFLFVVVKAESTGLQPSNQVPGED